MTQTTSSRPAKKPAPGWFEQLFFNRRRPHLRAIPKDWTKPDEDAYQKLIRDDDFVSTKYCPVR